ncbi:zinc ribbon domain-containing protein [Streptomyces chiangmaiensis]|uniref:Zinc ribbon domain-containing protein n=1 Tax=Streptomyces chiangmaiensis TaxID=766497 RepID=A0ABU7FAN7_9ACTN|nr:zinc ribbon domain-containing protein [Streptomyces chiangmaiensis]MED7821143.1 zinc ribbon domain-containing protein [Streptomyces chiangmaiensis]
MPTAIAVTSPDLVLPPLDRQTPPATVQPGPTLEQSLNAMHTLVEQHGYVIALHPASGADPAVQRLRTVRSVLESDRIAVLGVALPPLGLALLAQQLRQLSVCDFSPGVLASSARLLAHYIYAGAVLGSVAKLDHVPVPLTSHATSWMPGAQFGVLANPRPQLVRIGQEGLPGPEFGTRMLVAAGQPPSDWVTAQLAPAWRVQGVATVPLPEQSARWWGTNRLVEFAAGLHDVSVLYQLVSSVRREICHWCGLELIGDRCGFCGAPLPPPSAQQPSTLARALPRGAT